MGLELYFDNDSVGREVITIDPIDPQVGETFTLELFGVQVSFTATAATDANVVSGLLAAIAASGDPEWQAVTASAVNGGDQLQLIYGGPSGIVRLWRGDAPAVAQVTEIVPADVSVGDVFSLTANGKAISYTATTENVSDVVAGLRAALTAADVPEFDSFEVDPNQTSKLILTASEPGVPFVITAAATAGGGRVTVAQTQQPAAGSQSALVVIIGDHITTFRAYHDGEQTAALNTATATDNEIATALNGLSGISGAAVTSTTTSTFRQLSIQFNRDDTSPLLIVEQDILPTVTTAVDGGGSGERQTVTLPDTSDSSAAYTLTLDGYTTQPIGGYNRGDGGTANAAAALNALLALPMFRGGSASLFSSNVTNLSFDVNFAAAFGNINQMAIVWSTVPEDLTITPESSSDGTVSANATFSVSVDADGGTFTLTANNETTAAIAFDASAAAVEAAVEGLAGIDAATVTGTPGDYEIEFVGSLSASAVTLTADGNNLTGTAGQSLTVTETTASRGPHHWNDPKNWSPEGIPAGGDAVRFEVGSVDCLYGLNQAGVLLSELHIGLAYGGQIGLPRTNVAGFYEYRERDLTIGAADILIGYGDGSGSGKIQLNTGTARVAMQVLETGGSSENGIPAVTWRGENVNTAISVLGGEFGVAMFADQSATFGTFTQTGGDSFLSNSLISRIYAPNQTLRCHNCRLGTFRLDL